MPMEITDLDGGRGNLISGTGVVTEEEYVETFKRHLSQNLDKFKRYRYSICDYTNVTDTNVSTAAITLISNLCEKAAAVNPAAVVAVVASQDWIYGLARMGQSLMYGVGWEQMAFRCRVDAEVWVKERVQEKYGITDLSFA